MNWKKIYKIQQRIEYFDQQIENLEKLAVQINDDHEHIHIYIEHDLHDDSEYPPSPFFQMIQGEDWKQNQNKELNFEPFHMSLKDDWAIDFIGKMLYVLKQQRERLEEKLTQAQNIMYRVYVEGIGTVEQTENNGIARRAFDSFKDMSKEDFGNVGGKNVYLYKGNETLASHEPKIKGDHHE